MWGQAVINKPGKQSADKKIKTVTIPYYEIVNYFETGQTFGEVALNSPNAKRTATIITKEICYLAVLDKKIYESYLNGSGIVITTIIKAKAKRPKVMLEYIKSR